MSELITRENAKQAICEVCYMFKYIGGSYTECRYYPCEDIKVLEAIPSAEAVQGDGKMIPIELKKRYPHSRDEDITDAFMRGYQSAKSGYEWIPCSERLPEAEDMYQPPEQRYLCQLEAYGERKFCVLSRLKGAISPFWDWYGVAVHDSEVTAWMPLPKPYKGGDDE